MAGFVDRAPRKRTLLRGRVCAAGLRAEDCVILNVSRGGARLRLQTPLSLPPHFRLEILKWRERYSVRLVWRHGLEAGIAFEELVSEPLTPVTVA